MNNEAIIDRDHSSLHFFFPWFATRAIAAATVASSAR